MDIKWSQKLTLSPIGSGELKRREKYEHNKEWAKEGPLIGLYVVLAGWVLLKEGYLLIFNDIQI